MAGLLACAQQGDDILLGGVTYRRPDTPEEDRHAFTVARLAQKKCALIPLHFLPHGIAVDPNNPYRIAVCEKIGPGAAIVDIQTREVTDIVSPAGREFYGHCAFSASGRALFTTETYTDGMDGAIVERDGETLVERGTFPSFGLAPHECQLHHQGETMVVTNGGGALQDAPPNIARIDMASRQLIEISNPTSSHLNAGHFYISSNQDLVLVSAPRAGNAPQLGGVSIAPRGAPLETVTSPSAVVDNMRGESLSVAIHGTTALVTHPEGHMISFWDTGTRNYIKHLAYQSPRGVTLSFDERYFIITYGADASAVCIDTATLQPVHDSVYPNCMLSGSHVYNWTRLIGDLGYLDSAGDAINV